MSPFMLDEPAGERRCGDRFIAYGLTLFVVELAGDRARSVPVAALDWAVPGFAAALAESRKHTREGQAPSGQRGRR